MEIKNSRNLDEKQKEQLVKTFENFEEMARSALAVITDLEKVAAVSGWESSKVLEIAKEVKVIANEVMNPLKEIRKTHDLENEYE